MSIPSRISPMGVPVNYSRRLNYLAAAERGQYITTDYAFKAQSKGSSLEIKLQLPPQEDMTSNDCSFGVTGNGSTALYNNQWHFRAGNDSEGQTFWSVFPRQQDIVFSFQNGKFSVNGSAETDTGKLPETDYVFDLFSMNRRDNHTTYLCAPGTRIYYCKFFENGTLVRNFIPVLDRYGVPCMFDSVTQQFFRNAGTGTFDYT